MTDGDDTTRLDVPRRKLLGALGTVGITSAGTGLGTSAYFNDTELFEDNSLTAGKLNLKLAGSVAASNSNAIDIETQHTSPIDGTTSSAFFGLSDIKPRDLAIVCLEIIIEGNPAHLKQRERRQRRQHHQRGRGIRLRGERFPGHSHPIEKRRAG